jgi:hypothetical protein
MTWNDAPVLKGGGQSRVPGGAVGVLRFGGDVSDTAVGVLTRGLQHAHTQEKYVGRARGGSSVIKYPQVVHSVEHREQRH